MTTLLDPPTTQLDPPTPEPEPLDTEPADTPEAADDAIAPVMLTLATVSAVLSGIGAAWMIGGTFRGQQARVVGIAGVLVGAALVYAATRWRSAVLQYAVLPVTLVLGALLMSSSTGAGTSSLPALVKDAVTSSQVLQPPIDFAPGWRLILIVVLGLLTSAAVSLSLSLRRPRLAVAVPAPLTVLAALIQPSGSAIATGAVSVGFLMMGLATSYAADGSGESFDAGFELRRLARSLLTGVGFVVLLVLASKLSFLFPQHDQNHVIPPRRPPVSPPPPDVPLFTVKGPLVSPLRLGVIDVYGLKEQAWLLPPVDNHRLRRLQLPADVPGSSVPKGGTQYSLTVDVEQATGHLLPDVPETSRVDGHVTVDYDPRTQGLTLAERPVYTGLTYTLTATNPPTGAQLSALPGTVPADIAPFLSAPPVPPAVQTLLADAPKGAYARLQFVRTSLYKHFTAAGAGKPTDVSADRVVQLLGGGTGNPYELSASEALLARWAGIPARIGYGYYNGTAKGTDTVEFRPDNAATYLEAYFAPYGWLPIVGVPPKAQQSLSNDQRNNDPNIQASNDLGLSVYLPVLSNDQLPLYEYVRYYLYRALPVLLGGFVLLLLYPVLLKRLRRRRRRTWAQAHGPAGDIAAAYCDLRDLMIDLGLPGRGTTPLEMAELIVEDEEHLELAWLVTRGLWGDLRAQLGPEDAEAARLLAASVGARLRAAQPETARLLAAVSRASLRHPHSLEVPNVWFELRLRTRAARVLSPVRVWRVLRGVGRRGLRPSAATGLLVVLALLGVGGCSSATTHSALPPAAFPTRIAPTAVAGFTVHDEAKAEQAYLKGAQDGNVIVSEGKVMSFNKDGLIQAALQVAQLKPGYRSSDHAVATAITRSVGKMRTLAPQHGFQLYAYTDGTQLIYLWFPTDNSMALLVVRNQISQGAAEALARSLIDYGAGGSIDDAALSAAFAANPLATTPPPGAGPSSAPRPSATPTGTASP